MLLIKPYTYRIYPTADQQQTLKRFFGCSRWMYNHAIEMKSRNHKSTCMDILKEVSKVRNKYTWLQECPAQVLQMAVRDLTTEYTSFTKGTVYPVFKKKGKGDSIKFPQSVYIKFKDSTIKIPKIGIIKCVYDRRFNGTIKMVKLYQTVTGKYYITIAVDNQKGIVRKLPVTDETSVGMCKGTNTWYALSNGRRVSVPPRITRAEANLKKQQRSLDRKIPGSNRREYQKQKVLLAYEYLNNCKRDYCQKVSTEIIRKYDTILVEHMSDPILNMLRYKCLWYGKTLIEVGACGICKDICSECGTVGKATGISWECKECSMVHNKNHNNALNIKNIGLRNQATAVK